MEPTSKSCAFCEAPLSADSVNGVCVICVFRTRPIEEPGDTPRPGATVGPLARVRPTVEDESPLPPNPPGLMLIRRLGRGGMGTVYLALDAQTRRFVGVKLLHAPGDRAATDRFQAEVRALAALAHPHIVTVFAANVYHHAPYFTMEYVRGGTLARYVRAHGPLQPHAAAVLLAAVARAAHFAHLHGIVHRDIKPGNVLLTKADDGGQKADENEADTDAEEDSALHLPASALIPKLSDFGLAKRTDRNDGLTVGGGGVGTPGFMAPEQVAGVITPRTDVYGLGATLYHAITGHPPIETESQAATAQAIDNEPTRARRLRPDVPIELEAIVHKCLEKNPAARYATAEELAADLDRFAAGEPVLAKPLTPIRRAMKAVARKRQRLARLALAALALVAAIVFGAATGDRSPAQQIAPPPRERVAATPPTPLVYAEGELAAGRPVTLVGPTGEPLVHKWILGPAAFAPSGGRDEACSYQAFGPSMLDLCPNPMTDSYRIRAELCQLDINTRDQDGKLPTGGVHEFGLYFGRKSVAGKDGWRAENSMAIWLTESPKVKPLGVVKFGRLVLTESSTQLPTLSHSSGSAAQFVQADSLPGPWRVIEVEVTPTRVKAWFGNLSNPPLVVANLPIGAVGKEYSARFEGLDKVAPNHGVKPPDWNPRGAIGVWSLGSAVALRNVTVTPLK